MKERPIQYFNGDYLERAKELNPDQILQFLEDFRILHSRESEKCKLISIKIEPSLLRAFKTKCELLGIPYQKEIKKLMRTWLS
jgi:predicted DNA binding CopG/RHH family protein